MKKAALSSKYQIVIPKEVRLRTSLRPGQKFMVLERGGVIHLVPDQPVSALRGRLKGKRVNRKTLRDKE